MELRVLHYFLAIVREGSITKAAASLHLTQPTLSRQIAQLEEELGVRLFTRSNRSISLTEDGLLLKRRAQELLALAEKTRLDLRQKGEELSGEVSIGSGEFRSSRCLARLVVSFRERHPRVRFTVVSGNADDIRERMEHGLLDLGLMLSPPDPGRCDALPMPVRERWGALVREDSPLAGRPAVRAEDLAGLPLIMGTGEFARSRIEGWFGPGASRIELAAAGNLQYNMAMLAAGRAGAAIGLALDCQYDGIRFVPLDPPLEAGTVLAWKRERTFPPAVSAFIEHARQALSGDSDGEIQ